MYYKRNRMVVGHGKICRIPRKTLSTVEDDTKLRKAAKVHVKKCCKTRWSAADDILLIKVHGMIGPRWRSIKSHFPQHTLEAVRCRMLNHEHDYDTIAHIH